MAHIYIYSPSGAVRDKAGFKRGVMRLKELGHEVEIDPAALKSAQRFAGDDAERLRAIERTAASGADVALMTRGGYGLSRSLPQINYKAISKSIDKGMLWLGYSDFTALQAALYVKTGAVTWAGPALCEDFGRGLDADEHSFTPQAATDDIMEACFDDLVQGVCEGSGWMRPAADFKLAPKSIAARADSMPAKRHFSSKNSKETGILWGGNLAMLSSLIGTPYLPPIKKGILWFEDVAEHPYKVERMLLQWQQAGILVQQKAIIFGQFSNYKLTPHDKGFKLQTVIERLRTQLKIPVLTGLPFGHVPTKVCLPFGQRVSLMTEGRDALLYWG
ncbi:LD-carboxypeptidase [Variovorax sp. PCZ-1]|uniref:LD-carboxypeptidase n=1 Tax=Variovorax sp. PCZ-1 TaxID=2835533 RepID=UPI001BD0C059|nr:LD-carboxypeptidase [Variovorax sp. PCZ-1]MBS7808286.1 LD-carboxypeptidase [Variovorax sp. PCZ-1]